MANTVVALYDDFAQAQRAVEALVDAGFDRNDISLVASDKTGDYSRYVDRPVTDDVSAGEGAGFGAVVGTLVGLGVALIPGVGPVLAAGPVAAALMAGIGAATGAVTGGIVAALVNFGVPEEDAELYAEGLRRGGALVSVHITQSAWLTRAEDVLKRFSPTDIHESAMNWPGYTNTNTTSSPVTNTAQQATYGSTHTTTSSPALTIYQPFSYYEPQLREHFRENYASMGDTYDDYLSAYRFGYTLAVDPRYREYDWNLLAGDAQQQWETLYPNSWARFSNAIYQSWCSVRQC